MTCNNIATYVEYPHDNDTRIFLYSRKTKAKTEKVT